MAGASGIYDLISGLYQNPAITLTFLGVVLAAAFVPLPWCPPTPAPAIKRLITAVRGNRLANAVLWLCDNLFVSMFVLLFMSQIVFGNWIFGWVDDPLQFRIALFSAVFLLLVLQRYAAGFAWQTFQQAGFRNGG